MKEQVITWVIKILKKNPQGLTGKQIRAELTRKVNKRDVPAASELGYMMARHKNMKVAAKTNNASVWVWVMHPDNVVTLNPFKDAYRSVQSMKPFGQNNPTPRDESAIIADVLSQTAPSKEVATLKRRQQDIAGVFNRVRDTVMEKNRQYGDSVLKPVRVFSHADPKEGLLVRIDDKLSRLVRGNDSIESDIDIYEDLMGYLAMLILFVEDE